MRLSYLNEHMIHITMSKPVEIIKSDKDRDKITELLKVYLESCYFICFTSKLFKYFINVIVFVDK